MTPRRPAATARSRACLCALIPLCLLVIACSTRPAPLPTGAVIPESHIGLRPATWRDLDQTIHRAVERDTIHGAVLLVARNGTIAYQLAVGTRDAWAMDEPPVTLDTIFDTASLAKPIATATAAGFAVHEGLIDSAAKNGNDWSLDDLLLHRAGMPQNLDWGDIVRASVNTPAREALLAAMVDRSPSGVLRYSNAGYLLAGCLIEDVTDERLSDTLAPRIWNPLGMQDTAFQLSNDQRERVARAAGDITPGQPFDPLADYWLARMRSDPGHSGLFSTAPDIARWSIAMMRAFNDEDDELHDIARFVLAEPIELRDADGRLVRRTRGFLVREDDHLFGPVLEHTGFTGCALWLDPRREIAVILLTCGGDTDAASWRRMSNDILRTIRIGARHGR